MKIKSDALSPLFVFLILLMIGNSTVAQTTVNGNITSNTTWSKANSPYFVNDDIHVLEGVTLTIQPGVIVKFEDYYADIWISGTIKSIGNASESVIFTSYKDDAHGGDTNGDGSATSPAADNWGGIVLNNSSSGNQFHYCWFGYGGGYATSAILEVKNSDAEIQNSTFTNSSERGVYVEKSALDIINCSFNNNIVGIFYNGLHATTASVLTNNNFQNNTNWAVIGKLFDCTSDITLSGNSSIGSSQNGFGMYDRVGGDVVFDGQSDFPFIIESSDISIAETASLSFSPGTGIKFQTYYSDIWVDGTLTAVGTVSENIYFTSLKDDVHGGDSNNDAGATSPAGDDWGAIIFNDVSTGNRLSYCHIAYGGGYSCDGNIWNRSSEVEVRNCNILNSSQYGIVSEFSYLDIQNSTFSENANCGILYNGLSTTEPSVLLNNQFTGNINWAVLGNLSSCQTNITLAGNSSTGSAQNGFGMYNIVGGNVVFDGQSDFPFIIEGSDISVAKSANLTFTPGTGIKFQTYYSDIWVDGTLTAVGTESENIYFSSLKDDAHGGDSNSDADATSPAGDDWGAIIFNDVSTGNRLSYCYIAYGGGYSCDGNIWNRSSEVKVRNCNILNSSQYGIVSEFSCLDIQNSIISGNVNCGILYNGLSETENSVISNTQFADNINWSVYGNLNGCKTNIVLTGNTGSGSSFSGFGIYGNVAGDVLFDGQTNFPFIVTGSDLNILENKKLTFSEGTTIKFENFYSDIWVNGTLDASGASNAPITFTSIKDDAHGGDSNSDAVATTPEGNDWGGIIFNDVSTGSKLAYCYIAYGGGYACDGNIWNRSSEVEIRNCNILNSFQNGIVSEFSCLDIQNSIISGNANCGIYYNGLSETENSVISNTQFADNINWSVYGNLNGCKTNIVLTGNTGSGSFFSGFGIYGNIAGEILFDGQIDFPFIVAGSDLNILENEKLTFSEGTTVKFENYYSDIWVNGTLDATGTTGNPIVFTSINDDAHGGDTNGDASITSPAGDDWGTIQFYNTSSNNKLVNCWIGYGGGYASSALVTIYTSGLDMDYSTVTYSSDQGIYINAANPEILNTSICNNITGIYTTTSALPKITSNQIINNSSWGVYNADAAVDVDARNNWWGHASGPYHEELNVSGQGNEVSDHVLFNPWSTVTSANKIVLGEGLVLGRHYPNPAFGKLTVPFEIENMGRVLLQVINLDGKVLKTVLNENRQAGVHQVEINSSGLINGTYLLRLTSNNLSKISRFIVLN